MLTPYRALLREPGARRLLGAAFVGRLPLGIEGLAILLLVRAATGSYAAAGLVSAASGFAAMASTPVLGRLMDRRGQRGVVLATALGHPALLALLVLLAPAAPVGALVACAVGVGLLFPPLSPALRALLPRLLEGRRERLDTAFALDAIAIEVFFIVGPLLAAGLSAAVHPAAAVLLAGLLALAGGLLYASAPLARTWRGPALPASGPLAAPGLRTLMAVAFPLGVAVGALEVGLPAFADERGAAELGGVLLAVWAAASLVGGLLYGARRHVSPLPTRLFALSGVLALGYLAPTVARDFGTMGVACVLAGVALAPVTIVMYALVEQVSPAGTAAEANAWLISAIAGGAALGTALGGWLAERPGPESGFALAAGAAALGALLALARRRSLAPLPSPVA